MPHPLINVRVALVWGVPQNSTWAMQSVSAVASLRAATAYTVVGALPLGNDDAGKDKPLTALNVRAWWPLRVVMLGGR